MRRAARTLLVVAAGALGAPAAAWAQWADPGGIPARGTSGAVASVSPLRGAVFVPSDVARADVPPSNSNATIRVGSPGNAGVRVGSATDVNVTVRVGSSGGVPSGGGGAGGSWQVPEPPQGLGRPPLPQHQ